MLENIPLHQVKPMVQLVLSDSAASLKSRGQEEKQQQLFKFPVNNKYQENQSTVVFCLGRYVETSCIAFKKCFQKTFTFLNILCLNIPPETSARLCTNLYELTKLEKHHNNSMLVYQLVDPNVHQKSLTAKGLSSFRARYTKMSQDLDLASNEK